LFTLLFAAVFMGEPVRRPHWVAAVIGFAGVALLLQPGPGVFAAAGLLALAAAMLTGAEVATIRVLARSDPTLTVLVLNNALGGAVAVMAAAPLWVAPGSAQAWLLAAIGPVMVAGQALLVLALRWAAASDVAPFYYATILWGAVIGVLAFGEVPGPHLLAGGLLVAISGIWLVVGLSPAGGRSRRFRRGIRAWRGRR
jgi:drug/metabolite transporter (DMT)-like permease